MKNDFLVVGLMSGTSLDGLDVALCRFTKNETWSFSIEEAQTFEYDATVKKILSHAHLLNGIDLSLLDVVLGKLHGSIVKSFLEKIKAKPDFIASHGHTIFHQPEKGLTLQISNAAHISAITVLPVIAGFRTTDVALGGQGAPLVPIVDLHLFPGHEYCLNLGGIANVSLKNEQGITAFDICICNMALNFLAQQLGKEYDASGELARSGEVDLDLLSKLNSLSFYSAPAPKSLGKEFFDASILPLIKDLQPDEIHNALRTFVEHIAIQIGSVCGDNASKKMLVTGGGALNSFLVERVKALAKVELVIPEEKIIHFKEALVFAFLGVLRYRNEVNCLASVTGASRDNIGGTIHFG